MSLRARNRGIHKHRIEVVCMLPEGIQLMCMSLMIVMTIAAVEIGHLKRIMANILLQSRTANVRHLITADGRQFI